MKPAVLKQFGGKRMPRKATIAQAQLHLQVYDLRREPLMREAREWFVKNYWAETPEEAGRIQQVAPPGSRENAFLRMVISYWDQACVMLNQGLLHEELFFETTGEFYLVWTRIQHVLPQMRKQFSNPRMFEALEKAAQRYEKYWNKRAPGALEARRKFMASLRQQSAAAKA